MANLKMSKTKVNVGVDVGKFFLDVYIYEKGIYFTTGRYEFSLAEACYSKKLPVVIAKPISIRRYAGAIDQLAKTDKIDAQLIAEYAAVLKPKATPQKRKNLITIKNLLTRRRQIMHMRTQELNRIKIMGKSFEASCKRMIKLFDKEILSIENKLQKHVCEQEEWNEKKEILLSAPGVGNTLVYSILADLPEIGSLTNNQISKLVGVAPINRDSGKTKGKRRVIGGRANIRTTLYMATLSATLCNPAIKSFYHRLKAKGKHSKVAITACMRKFITILNTMIRDKKEWCVS